MIEPDRTGYKLSLIDGTQWFLAGDTQINAWVDRLAFIMNLKKSNTNGSRKLDFIHRSETKPEKLEMGAMRSENPYVTCGTGTLRFNDMDMSSHVTCEIDNSGADVMDYINMSFSLYPIYYRSLLKGGLPLHSSLVEFEGRGILLTGPGDTGKTTCCERLPENWKPLCDDETLVVCDTQKKYHSHPFPTWSNYLWKRNEPTYDVQYAIPVSAVFFLEQYQTDEVVTMGQGESAAMISQSSMQVFERLLRKADKETKNNHLSRIFSNACEMAKAIPAFKLRASLVGKFWEKIEAAIG